MSGKIVRVFYPARGSPDPAINFPFPRGWSGPHVKKNRGDKAIPYSGRLLSGRHVIAPYISEIQRASTPLRCCACRPLGRQPGGIIGLPPGVIAVIAVAETDRSSNYSTAFSILPLMPTGAV